MLLAGEDHVGLEEGGGEIDVVRAELGEEGLENNTGEAGASLDGIIAIINKLGLDDRDKAGALAGGGVIGEEGAVLLDGVFGGGGGGNFKGGAPFGEAEAHLVVFLEPPRKPI